MSLLFSLPQGNHCPCRDGHPLLQAWVPVVLMAYSRQHGFPWLVRRITRPATSLVASDGRVAGGSLTPRLSQNRA